MEFTHHPQLPPAHCFLCRNANSRQGYIDTLFMEDVTGQSVYICYKCVTIMYDLLPTEMKQTEYTGTKQDIQRLERSLNDAKHFFKDVRGKFDVHLDRIAHSLELTSAFTYNVALLEDLESESRAVGGSNSTEGSHDSSSVGQAVSEGLDSDGSDDSNEFLALTPRSSKSNRGGRRGSSSS